MHLYRLHFLDATGAVTHCHAVQLPTDGAARNLGSRMLAKRRQDAGIEIWCLNHLVHRETKPKAVGRA